MYLDCRLKKLSIVGTSFRFVGPINLKHSRLSLGHKLPDNNRYVQQCLRVK